MRRAQNSCWSACRRFTPFATLCLPKSSQMPFSNKPFCSHHSVNKRGPGAHEQLLCKLMLHAGTQINDVALRDCQNCQIGRPYRDAQGRQLWRQDLSCTYLAHDELDSLIITMIIIVVVVIIIVVIIKIIIFVIKIIILHTPVTATCNPSALCHCLPVPQFFP